MSELKCWMTSDHNTYEMSQNYKISFSRFCGRLKNISSHWQLQILNFWMNLQNSNCITHCTGSTTRSWAELSSIHSWSHGHHWPSNVKIFPSLISVLGGREIENALLYSTHPLPLTYFQTPSSIFTNNVSLYYFVNWTKRFI